MSWRAIAILIMVLALALGGVVFAAICYQRAMTAVRDCYIQERVAEMIVEHLERNGGVWPRNWEELAEAYEICEGRAGGVWSIDEIRGCCGIDFDADSANLMNAEVHGDEPPFKVIYLRSGAAHYWSGGEPNRRIYEYLRVRAERSDDYRYPPHLASDEKDARRALLHMGAQWHVNKNGRVERIHMGSLDGSPRFNDESLRHVAKLFELKELILSNSNISDAGMRQLTQLAQLRYLDLSGTRVTDDGLRALTQMNSLEQLSLAFGPFTDLALDNLVKLPSLKMLNMNYTNITDKGVGRLAEMQHLEDVLIGDTLSSSASAQSLQSALPRARIYHSTRNKANDSTR